MSSKLHQFTNEVGESFRLIEEATTEGLPAFITDLRARAVVEWRLYRIGEMSRRYRVLLKEQFPAVPWDDIIRMRHRLAHHFMRVEPHVTYVIAVVNVPKLQHVLRTAANI